MQVRFLRFPTAATFRQAGEIYLQGAMLMTYKRASGRRAMPASDVGSSDALGGRDAAAGPQDLTSRRDTIEALDRDDLFYRRAVRAAEVDQSTSVRLRPAAAAAPGELLFAACLATTVGTTAIVDDEQKPADAGQARKTPRTTRCNCPSGDGAEPAAPRCAGRTAGSPNRSCPKTTGSDRPLSGTEAGRVRPVSVQPDGPGPRYANIDPIEDFVTEHPAGTLRVFRHRPDADAPQPGHSGADGRRLQVRRVERDGRLLPGAPVARPHLGRGLSAAAPDSARADARRRLLAVERREGRLAAARSDARWRGPDEQSTYLALAGPRALDWLDSVWSNYVVDSKSSASARPFTDRSRQACEAAWRAGDRPRTMASDVRLVGGRACTWIARRRGLLVARWPRPWRCGCRRCGRVAWLAVADGRRLGGAGGRASPRPAVPP